MEPPAMEFELGLAQTAEGASEHPHHQLLVASDTGDLATVRLLLDSVLTAPIDLAAHDQHGRTALALACWKGHLHIVRLLLERGAAWHAIDNDSITCGEYAQLGNHQQVYDEVLNAGIRTELVLKALQTCDDSQASSEYLRGSARYTPTGTLVDTLENGVMMEWERPLMAAHAQAMSPTGRDVLNVGFGMGIVDEAIQMLRPRSHTIIEAHPDVFARMQSLGWHKRAGVRVIFGRWQDVLPQLGVYDAIMFDTFGETNHDLSDFHESLTDLLQPHGTYTFFNGLAATNPFFHRVCCEVTRMSLAEMGIKTQYYPMTIDVSNAEIWAQVRDRYWTLDTYLLPVCTFEL